jgi:hypothetical protein
MLWAYRLGVDGLPTKYASPLPIGARETPGSRVRAWLDSGTLPVGQIIQRDLFGDSSAIRVNLNGDISEGPAGRVHPFGVDEQGLAGKPALAAPDFVAIARHSWKPWSAGASTDGCHLPLDVLAQILHQMEAIGPLPGCRRAFPDALGIEPTAIAAYEFDPGMLLQPVRVPCAKRVFRTSATARRSRSTTMVRYLKPLRQLQSSIAMSKPEESAAEPSVWLTAKTGIGRMAVWAQNRRSADSR